MRISRRLGPYMGRFNGLNYLSHPYLGSNNTTSYTDWSREHTPGHGQYYSAQHHSGGQYHDPYCTRSYPAHSSSRKSSSKTPDTTLGSSKRSSSKRDSSEMVYRGSSPQKKSALKNSSNSSHQPLLLSANGLSYDENSRVYHITP